MTGWLLSAKIMKLKSTTATTIRKLEIKLNLKKKKNFKTFSYFTNYVHLGNKNENKSKNLCQHHFLFFFFFLAHFQFKSIRQQERRKRPARFTPHTHAQ